MRNSLPRPTRSPRGLRLLACCALFALLCAALPAAAQDALYVFPYEGVRLNAPETWQVLTQHNLDEHADWLASVGTDAPAMRAAYQTGGIVLEVITDSGHQVNLFTAPADGLGTQPLAQRDAAGRDAFLSAYSAMGRYADVAFAAQSPDWLRMTFSSPQGGMVVYTLRYVTLMHGQQYILSCPVVGRAPDEADEQAVLDVVGCLSFLAALADPTPSPSPEPTPTPEPTPRPTPGEAPITAQQQGMALWVAPPPAWTDEGSFSITGTTLPRAALQLYDDTRVIARATANTEGGFTLACALDADGVHTLRVEATLTGQTTAWQTYSVTYEMPALPLRITEPTEPMQRSQFPLRGVTAPGARVAITGSGFSGSVVANQRGEFSIRLTAEKEGDYPCTLTATLAGYRPATMEYTVTRELTRREALGAFRGALVNISYRTLTRDPAAQQGKRVNYRGRIAEIRELDGMPCLLLMTESLGRGRWGSPVWVTCEELLPYAVGDNITAYVQVTGNTLPYTDAQGETVELPVLHLHFHDQ